MSDTPPAEPLGLYWELQPPTPSNATERYAWDVLYKGNMLLGLPQLPPRPPSGPTFATASAPPSPVYGGLDAAGTEPAGTATTLSPTTTATTLVDPSSADTESGSKEEIKSGTFTGLTPVRVTAVLRGRLPSGGRYLVPEPDDSVNLLGSPVYKLRLLVAQLVPQDSLEVVGATTFSITPDLVVDTGSNTTWLYGIENAQLPSIALEDLIEAESFNLIPWSINDYGMRPALLIKHPFRKMITENATIKAGNLEDEPPAQLICYLDGSAAYLTLAEDLEPVVFSSAYAYSQDVSWKADLKLKYRFSAAFASTTLMHGRPWDGILGMGLNRQQDAFQGPRFTDAPSFPCALFQQSVGIPGPNEAGQADGLVFYYILRAQGTGVASILGLNRWPCPQMPRTWSSPIPISLPERNAWVVRLKKVQYSHYDLQTKTWSSKPAWELKLGQDEEGIDVYLDTGCSLSWLPASIIVHLRTKVLPTSRNLEIDREEGVEPTPITPNMPYVQDRKRYLEVPSDVGHWSIMYTFRGQRGEDVPVTGSCYRFLGDRHPANFSNTPTMESLMRIAPGNIYVLGLPFFHTTYVAMHNPRPLEDFSRGAFVRLATSEDIVPGERSNVNPPELMM